MIILFTGQTRLRSMRFFGESTGPRCFFRSTPLPSFPRGERSTPPMHLTLGHLMRKTLRALRYHFSMMLYCIRKYREILFLLWCGWTRIFKFEYCFIFFKMTENVYSSSLKTTAYQTVLYGCKFLYFAFQFNIFTII